VTPSAAKRPLPDDQPQHIARLLAQRDTNADFLHALRDRVSQQAIQPNAREQQRQRAE